MVIFVFGVSGAGKTTVGKRLAHDLGWRFIEADDFHPAANIEKVRSGRTLTDEDRWPWLERLRKEIKRLAAAGENAVLARSALKRAYRAIRLRVSDEVRFVFLRGDYALIEKQLRNRPAYFMNPTLLPSQFDDLEPWPDEDALTIELGRTPKEIVNEIKARLYLASRD